MRSSTSHDIFLRVKGFDYVILESAAHEKFSSCLLCLGVKHVLSINDISEDLANKAFIFIVSSPFTSYLLEKIASVVFDCGKRSALILTTVEATGNCELFKLPHINEYPEYEVQYLSKDNKLFTFKVEFIFSCPRTVFTNLFILPKPHALLPGLEDYSAIFYDINSILWSLKVFEEVYSFGQTGSKIAAQFADFPAAVNRKKSLYNNTDKCTASVIFIDESAICDPVACLEPYTRPNHLLDLIFAELSPDGYRVNVSWEQLFKCSFIESESHEKILSDNLYTDLMQSMDMSTNPLLDEYFMLKDHASLSKIQQNLLQVAGLIHHELPELSEPPRTKAKWADLLRSQVKELFIPICKSGRFDLLNHIQLTLSVINAFESVTSRNRYHIIPDTDVISLEKLLVKFERSLLVASQADAKLIQQLQKPTHCEPILLNAYKEAANLPNLDELFLFVTHTINLIPIHLPVSESIWSAIRELFTTGRSKNAETPSIQQRVPGGLIPNGLSVNNLVQNIKLFREKRAQLPSYNNLVGTTQARYQSPLVQMMKDLVLARENPSEASPALNGVVRKPCSSLSGNWLGELSRFIRIPGSSSVGTGVGAGNEKFPLYKSDYIILIPMGTGSFPIRLCRELFEINSSHSMMMNKSSPTMFKLKIITSGFSGGRAGISSFLNVDM
uniref:Uncharacterized protein n=1 Tax=Schistosoma japonicum TaxID=6182 RepID=C1L557_SCHJA|nr:hypothetical protein [Schistosoma japonicum]